jgi:hypothetical protein
LDTLARRPHLGKADWIPTISELLWAVYGAVQVLGSSSNAEYQNLAKDWQSWLDYAKTTASRVRKGFLLMTLPNN